MQEISKPIKALGLFVVVLIVAFGSVAWFMTDLLQKEYTATQQSFDRNYKQDIQHIDDAEWGLLKTTLLLSLSEAEAQGDLIVKLATEKIYNHFDNNIEAVAKELDNYNEPNNYIRATIADLIPLLDFNDLHTNNTDGFVVKDNFVREDSSDNCVSFGASRNFFLELLMHANPPLALETFNKISNGTADTINFFQFDTHPDGIDMQKGYDNIPLIHQKKLGLDLSEYTVKGIEAYYRKTKSWEKSFMSFEFVTTSYMFDKTDIALRAYIEQGTRTEVSRLSLNVVFNLKTVIDNNTQVSNELARFKAERRSKKYVYEIESENLKLNFLMKQRVLYLVVSLLMIICFISMHYTNKLVEEVDK